MLTGFLFTVILSRAALFPRRSTRVEVATTPLPPTIQSINRQAVGIRRVVVVMTVLSLPVFIPPPVVI